MHWQNLNEYGKRKGNPIRHGRAWFGPFGIEWTVLKDPRFRIGIGLAHYETAISFSLALLLFSIHCHYDNFKWQSWLEEKTKREDQTYGNGRVIELYWHEMGLWAHIWSDPMESRSKDQWWCRTLHLDFVDLIFGQTKYRSKNLEQVRAVVPMPEGGYPATVKINEDTWTRPRWPFAWTRRIRSEVIPDKPIPFPGKGENSWDCGEDALHSLYGTYDTPLKAVMAASESVMRSRLRYGGGWNYQPEPEKQTAVAGATAIC